MAFTYESDPAVPEQLTNTRKMSYIKFCDSLINFVSWIALSNSRKTSDYHIFWTRTHTGEKGPHLCLSVERHRKGYETNPNEKKLPGPLLIDVTKLYAEYLESPGISKNIETARCIRRDCVEYFEKCNKALKEKPSKRSIFIKPAALFEYCRFATAL